MGRSMYTSFYKTIFYIELFEMQDPLSGIIPRALHQLFEKLECQVNLYDIVCNFLNS